MDIGFSDNSYGQQASGRDRHPDDDVRAGSSVGARYTVGSEQKGGRRVKLTTRVALCGLSAPDKSVTKKLERRTWTGGNCSMDDRYPHIRFVTDAARVIAGGVAALVFLSGTMHSCHHGGFPGFMAFVITLAITAAAYVVVMVKLEVLRVLLDIEGRTRQPRTTTRAESPPAPST